MERSGLCQIRNGLVRRCSRAPRLRRMLFKKHIFVGLFLALSSGIEPVCAQTPQINPGGVLNGASFDTSAPIAPGVIFSIFGTNLTDGGEMDAPGAPLPTRLSGARVLVNNVEAPLFFVSPLQINAQFPVELAGLDSALIQVEMQSAGGTFTSDAVTVSVASASPGIFTLDQTGYGPGAILRNSDFSLICPQGRTDCASNPAIRGEAIAIYLTGLGQVMGPWSSGEVATEAARTTVTPVVQFDGDEVPVLYSGLAAGFVGLYQINVVVPETASLGVSRSLWVTMAGTTHIVNIAIGSGNAPVTGIPETLIRSLAVDPSNPSLLLAGTGDAGIFRSVDGGRNWTAAMVPLGGQDIRALAFSPGSPGTAYAATGNGVIKSTDSGDNWTVTAEIPLSFSLAVDPVSPSTIYVGTNFGVYKSTSGGANWASSSTGVTDRFVRTLAIDPASPATIYAGTEGGVFKSVNAGATWIPAETGLPEAGVGALAIDPASSSIIYAGMEDGVFRSDDGGASWTKHSSGIIGSVGRLLTDPVTPAALYAGTNGAGIFKTTDGGQTWVAANTGLPLEEGVAAGGLVMDPSDPSTLYVGTLEGRVFRSTDGAATWTLLGPE